MSSIVSSLLTLQELAKEQNKAELAYKIGDALIIMENLVEDNPDFFEGESVSDVNPFLAHHTESEERLGKAKFKFEPSRDGIAHCTLVHTQMFLTEEIENEIGPKLLELPGVGNVRFNNSYVFSYENSLCMNWIEHCETVQGILMDIMYPNDKDESESEV